ncbi:hypothetical protein KQ945_18255 [Bacillus subtilis subsp. subtilis]|nr:hypothetical protein [Bacillus subtilis subsp. subtilis]
MHRYPASIQAALHAMQAAGVPTSLQAPPLHRLLWRVGMVMPPPLLAGFAANALLMGVFFAVGWGVLMVPLFGLIVPLSTLAILGSAGGAGALFGVIMALVMRYQQQRYPLPAWRSLRRGGTD